MFNLRAIVKHPIDVIEKVKILLYEIWRDYGCDHKSAINEVIRIASSLSPSYLERQEWSTTRFTITAEEDPLGKREFDYLPTIARSDIVNDRPKNMKMKYPLLSASMLDRFPKNKRYDHKYDFANMKMRWNANKCYEGTKGPNEAECLAFLNKELKRTFQNNESTLVKEGVKGIPDAVESIDGAVVSVAEFKSFAADSTKAQSRQQSQRPEFRFKHTCF
jgi:hypothetical protein